MPSVVRVSVLVVFFGAAVWACGVSQSGLEQTPVNNTTDDEGGAGGTSGSGGSGGMPGNGGTSGMEVGGAGGKPPMGGMGGTGMMGNGGMGGRGGNGQGGRGGSGGSQGGTGGGMAMGGAGGMTKTDASVPMDTAGMAGSGGSSPDGGVPDMAPGPQTAGRVQCGNLSCNLEQTFCCVDDGYVSCNTRNRSCGGGSARYCDGPEDCDSGDVCCGRTGDDVQQEGYRSVCSRSTQCLPGTGAFVLCQGNADCPMLTPMCCPVMVGPNGFGACRATCN